MKKMVSKFIPLSLVLIMSFAFWGCGSFDPSAYVDSQLNYLKTGEVTEEMLANTGLTEEQLEEDYEDLLDDFVDSNYTAGGEAMFEDNEANRSKVREAGKAFFKAMEYEVNEEYTEEDDSYFVEVRIYPSKLLDELENWSQKWREEHEGAFKTQEEVYESFWNSFYDYIIENATSVGYGEPKVITVEIEPDDDGVYDLTEESSSELFNAVFE